VAIIAFSVFWMLAWVAYAYPPLAIVFISLLFVADCARTKGLPVWMTFELKLMWLSGLPIFFILYSFYMSGMWLMSKALTGQAPVVWRFFGIRELIECSDSNLLIR